MAFAQDQLPGQIMTALLLAAPLAFGLSHLLLRRYVRGVEQAMRSAIPAARTTQDAAPATAMSPAGSALALSADALLDRLRSGPWRAAALQALAAFAPAFWFACVQLWANDIEFSRWRVLMFVSTYLWPGVLCVMLVAGISARQRFAVLMAGALFYLTAGVVSSTQAWPVALRETSLLWTLINLPPTLYLLLYAGARIRSVGPLVLLVCLLTVAGATLPLAVLATQEDWLLAVASITLEMGLGVIGTFAVLILAGALPAFFAGTWLLHRLARAYAAWRIGDQGILLAAVWLTFTMLYSIDFVFAGTEYLGLGLLAFPVYLAVSWLLHRTLPRTTSDEAPALLMLRVFARKGRAPALLRAVSRHWRHAGPIRMIAGYDLATETIEPDELMAFLRGRLADNFVTGPDIVDRRLADARPRRDGDGRFRTEEFFCFDNTWRYTLQRLVATSAVVLMDLRGFGADNRGCIFELAELADCGALSRTVLLHDASTDMHTLREEMGTLCVAQEALPLLELTGQEARDLPALLQALARAGSGKRYTRKRPICSSISAASRSMRSAAEADSWATAVLA